MDAIDAQILETAVARTPLRNSGPARFRETTAIQAVSVRTPRWVATSIADTGVRAPGVRSDVTWTEQRAAVAKLNRNGEEWQLILEQET